MNSGFGDLILIDRVGSGERHVFGVELLQGRTPHVLDEVPRSLSQLSSQVS